MKKLWIMFKIAIAYLDIVAEVLSVLVYVGIGYGIFSKLKWTWTKRVESKLAYWALRCCDRAMAFNENLLALLRELGIDTFMFELRLERKNSELSDLWKEGCRIYGWRIVKINGYTTLIK